MTRPARAQGLTVSVSLSGLEKGAATGKILKRYAGGSARRERGPLDSPFAVSPTSRILFILIKLNKILIKLIKICSK